MLKFEAHCVSAKEYGEKLLVYLRATLVFGGEFSSIVCRPRPRIGPLPYPFNLKNTILEFSFLNKDFSLPFL